jgi:hypothetical protein
LVGQTVESGDTGKATAVIDGGKIKITSKDAGTVTITVKDGAKTASIPVTVSDTGAITIGTITKYTAAFTAAENTVANNNDTLGMVGTEVSSGDTGKAAVKFKDDSKGEIIITSVAPGTATITVKDGAKTATIQVTVSDTGAITRTITKYEPPAAAKGTLTIYNDSAKTIDVTMIGPGSKTDEIKGDTTTGYGTFTKSLDVGSYKVTAETADLGKTPEQSVTIVTAGAALVYTAAGANGTLAEVPKSELPTTGTLSAVTLKNTSDSKIVKVTIAVSNKTEDSETRYKSLAKDATDTWQLTQVKHDITIYYLESNELKSLSKKITPLDSSGTVTWTGASLTGEASKITVE